MSSASAVVPQAAPTAITVRPNECPDISGHDFAEAGVLSAGSFTAEDIGPQPERQDGHKVWIASQRKGHDDATLRITGPDGQAHLERRKSHICPGPQVSHSSTPGIFPSPRAVSIGSESGSDATRCA
jgi:hypothetical protein